MAIDLTRCSVLLLAACTWALPATAQTSLADPTRPPAAFLSPDGSAPAVVTAVPLSRLTSVKLPQGRGGAPSAVIDGQLLRVGERLGEARLVRVSETQATLEGPDGRETLYLIPDINKKPAATRSAGRPSAKEMR